MADPTVAESWRAIPGTDGGYEVSNLGRVRSWRVLGHTVAYRRAVPLVLKPFWVGRKALTQYQAVYCGLGRSTKIHTLVASQFIGPRPVGLVINHIDGDRTNNAASNLEYVTNRDNCLHARRLGLQPIMRGVNVGTSRLTDDDVRAIRNSTEKGVVLAVRYGVTGTQISNIRLRRQWQHVA